MVNSREKNYFPGGNTCRGFYSFYEYLPQEAELVFVIKGGPGTGKSTFMKKIGNKFSKAGYNIEYHWCSSDAKSLDGVVIPQLKTALIDGTAPHLVDPEYPGAVDEIINLGRYWDKELLQNYKDEIVTLNDVIWKYFDHTYAYLREAKLIHDQWEKYYIENMDFQMANRQADKLIKEILGDRELAKKLGKERHLFASAFTPQGTVDYFNNLTRSLDKRYIIKGRPGTGKSTLTKKIARAARERGLKVDYFHCSFDPESVDMIIISELKVGVIDGTSPHVLDPEDETDEVVDMLACVDQEEIKKKEEKIAAVKERYNQVMNKALKKLQAAKELHDEVEKYYIKAMDFQAVDERRKEVTAEIYNWADVDI